MNPRRLLAYVWMALVLGAYGLFFWIPKLTEVWGRRG
jgi:hypothetical protein